MSKTAKALGGIVAIGIGILTGGLAIAGAGTFAGLIGPSLAIGKYLLISWALDVAATNLISTPGRPKGLPQDVEYSETTSPGRIIYGKQKVSGMNVIPPWKSGAKFRYLHQALVLACHEVEDITDVYFNQTAIADANIGAITGTANDGLVGGGDYEDAAWIRRYLGTSSQTADFILNNAFSEWTSNHRGRGNAYLAIQYDLENTDVYENGKPEVSCIVLGKKCYDPRLDTLPGANPTSSSYSAYTTNPALCLADYLVSDIGLKEKTTRIDWDSVVAAADICDEDVVVPPAASPSNTQKRYTCNVTLEVAQDDQEVRNNILTLVSSMLGAVDFRGGKWRIHAGAADESTFELTETDMLGQISMRTELPPNQKYNYVRGQFLDRDRNYQPSEYEPRSNSTYETDDGNGTADRRPKEVNFPACDNQYEAQRNAIITLKRSRRRQQLSARFAMSAYKIRLWDTGTINLEEFGWTAQKVRCIAWSFNQEGTIDATFLEEDDSDWDDPAVGDYTTVTGGSGPSPSTATPEEFATFACYSRVDGVSIIAELPVGWIGGTDLMRVYAHTSASPFASATLMETTNSNRVFIPLTDADPRYWWITHVRRGVESDENPDGDGVECAALALTAVFHATVDRSSHLRILVDTSAGTTSLTSTVTASQGTAPYTYAWTRTAGSTKISVVSSTSATTAFSASGLADGDNESATFRCRVTDDTAATYDVFVGVTFRRNDDGYL